MRRRFGDLGRQVIFAFWNLTGSQRQNQVDRRRWVDRSGFRERGSDRVIDKEASVLERTDVRDVLGGKEPRHGVRPETGAMTCETLTLGRLTQLWH